MNASVNSLLNDSLDSIEDMPSTAAWPIGAHIAQVKLEISAKNPAKPMVIGRATLISTEEQADTEAAPASPGDQYSWFYSLKKKDGTRNDFALQQLKAYFGEPLVKNGELSTAASLTEVIEQYKDGKEMLLTTGIKMHEGNQQMTLKTTTLI